MIRFKISLIEERSTWRSYLKGLACPSLASISRESLIVIRALGGRPGAE